MIRLVGKDQRKHHLCDQDSTNEKELDDIICYPFAVQIQQPWGMIYKDDVITEFFGQHVHKLKEIYDLYGQTSSVALAVMQPHAFHRPYIRHASTCTEAYDYGCMRAYKVLAGSFTCVRNNALMTCTPASGYIIVREFDIFSFKAGPRGCVFGIIDFPAFSPGIDANEVR